MPRHALRSAALLAGASVVLVALTACPTGPTEPACELTLDSMVGKSFVMSEAQPNGPDKLNPLARLTFVEDGGVKAKYTAMSLGDIYTYDCEKLEKKPGEVEWKCVEKARVQDWCEALLAWEKACTKKSLRDLGAPGTDEELDAIVAKARESKKAADESGDERTKKRWTQMRANLGNKLQGQIFAKVDDKKCRLRIDDLYWTLYEGNKKEDSNPVGTNPFVVAEQPWMFEHCDNQADLWDLEENVFPTAPLAVAPSHAAGKPIHYFHTAELGSKPEEGCTYSFDTWAGWLPLKKDLVPETNAEGRLIWHAEHTFGPNDIRTIQDADLALFHMARYKTCGGKKERIDLACRTSRL
jgi:hypothetical protein